MTEYEEWVTIDEAGVQLQRLQSEVRKAAKLCSRSRSRKTGRRGRPRTEYPLASIKALLETQE